MAATSFGITTWAEPRNAFNRHSPSSGDHLVSRPGDFQEKLLELLQDRDSRGGPVERILCLVVGSHELRDFCDQFPTLCGGLQHDIRGAA